MKTSVLAALVALIGSSVALAEDGQPTFSRLTQLGLSSMKVVSDAQGQQVRGEGYVEFRFAFRAAAGATIASGSGFSQAGTPFSSDTVTTQGLVFSPPLVVESLGGTGGAPASVVFLPQSPFFATFPIASGSTATKATISGAVIAGPLTVTAGP